MIFAMTDSWKQASAFNLIELVKHFIPENPNRWSNLAETPLQVKLLNQMNSIFPCPPHTILPLNSRQHN